MTPSDSRAPVAYLTAAILVFLGIAVLLIQCAGGGR